MISIYYNDKEDAGYFKEKGGARGQPYIWLALQNIFAK